MNHDGVSPRSAGTNNLDEHVSPSFDRVIGRLSSPVPGPTLIVIGGMHGNEPAGAIALSGIVSRLAEGPGLARGDFLALAGNLSALSQNQRYIDEDLNRCFDGVEHPTISTERREQTELLQTIESAIGRARGGIVLMDLHTTSGGGAPFSVFADTMASRNFAIRFPVPVVLGLEEQLAGTLIDFIGLRGHIAVGFEGGQHQDPRSVDVLEAVISMALGELGLVAEPKRDREQFLKRCGEDAPGVLEMVYRHEVHPDDHFSMLPGFESFQPVTPGQVLATDVRGDVKAPESGYLLMPLYQQQGNDGFFVVRKVRRFWLWFSAPLRYARAGRFAHWLPGVSKIAGRAHLVRVNRRLARWYSVEVLHLLGFRRRTEQDGVLLMERRAHDLP